MKYDEVEYWNKRENPNSASEESTRKHIEFVRKSIAGCRSILDFGPGIGRIFPAYENIDASIEGYDISKQYAAHAVNKAKVLGLDFKLTTGDMITDLPYSDNEFDCAVVVSVLLHQRPNHIMQVMSELLRVSKKVIVISWYEPDKNFIAPHSKPRPKDYCFNYDYLEICKLQSWIIQHKHTSDRQLFFTYVAKSR